MIAYRQHAGRKFQIFVYFLVGVLVISGCSLKQGQPSPVVIIDPTATKAGAPPSAAQPTPMSETSPPPKSGVKDPQEQISLERMFTFLEALTAIQAHSGWRNSGSLGEAEAIELVAGELGKLSYLADLGMQLERQRFRVYMSTELWESKLVLAVNGSQIEVPADGLRGPRYDIEQARRFDSDGELNDSERDPQQVEAPAVFLRTRDEIGASGSLEGKIAFVKYALIDRVVLEGLNYAVPVASQILAKKPAALVVVTQNSYALGESHGFGIGDVSALNWVRDQASVPTLYVRLEDLESAGIQDWDDLEKIESANLTWDADVFSPGESGNLIAHIPGADPSQALILGSHIDSPNSPGALDDGSGVVALLETARALDAAGYQPPIDLYLAWFGSEEIGLCGAAYFANTHQELLDRTLAMLQVDNLTRPLDGIQAQLTLAAWSYASLGDASLPWPDYLMGLGLKQGIDLFPEDIKEIYSDNSTFSGYGVPNADLIYSNDQEMEATGSWHYAAHVHDPYDTVEQARQVGDVLEQMARVALAAVVNAGKDGAEFRVAPEPQHRAVFVASHTEAEHMAPAMLIELGMALAWEGYDVDLVPYGQAVTSDDLQDADLVVALPVFDYPGWQNETQPYDEAWSQAEIDVLSSYVQAGGWLVLTNSNSWLRAALAPTDINEDALDVNALAGVFGVDFQEGKLAVETFYLTGDHPLMEGIRTLRVINGNGLPFSLQNGLVLGKAGDQPVIALVDYGNGQVLVLADLGIFSGATMETNLEFWQRLARYAASR